MSTVKTDPIFSRVRGALANGATDIRNEYLQQLRVVAAAATPDQLQINELVRVAQLAGIPQAEVMADLDRRRKQVTQTIIVMPHPKCVPPEAPADDRRMMKFISALRDDGTDWTRCPHQTIRPKWMSEALHADIAEAMACARSTMRGSRQALELAAAEGFPINARIATGPEDGLTNFATAAVNAIAAKFKDLIASRKYRPLPPDVTAERIANESFGRLRLAVCIANCLEAQGRLIGSRRIEKNGKVESIVPDPCRRLTIFTALFEWL